MIGIGEQNPEMFASPYFRALGVKHVRVITAWDSLRHRWSRDALDRYMLAARDAGVQVLLGFGHSRSKKYKVRRHVPSVREFTREFLKYKKRYPWQKEWLTWNEANHCGEPTCHKPGASPASSTTSGTTATAAPSSRPTCSTARRWSRGSASSARSPATTR